jgi:hypothetical protein
MYVLEANNILANHLHIKRRIFTTYAGTLLLECCVQVKHTRSSLASLSILAPDHARTSCSRSVGGRRSEISTGPCDSRILFNRAACALIGVKLCLEMKAYLEEQKPTPINLASIHISICPATIPNGILDHKLAYSDAYAPVDNVLSRREKFVALNATQ